MHRLTAGVFRSTLFREYIAPRDRSFIFPDLEVNLTLARYRLHSGQKKKEGIPMYAYVHMCHHKGLRMSEGNVDKRLRATKSPSVCSYFNDNKRHTSEHQANTHDSQSKSN